MNQEIWKGGICIIYVKEGGKGREERRRKYHLHYSHPLVPHSHIHQFQLSRHVTPAALPRVSWNGFVKSCPLHHQRRRKKNFIKLDIPRYVVVNCHHNLIANSRLARKGRENRKQENRHGSLPPLSFSHVHTHTCIASRKNHQRNDALFTSVYLDWSTILKVTSDRSEGPATDSLDNAQKHNAYLSMRSLTPNSLTQSLTLPPIYATHLLVQ